MLPIVNAGALFESIFAEIAKCTKCRDEIPKIGSLPEGEFALHWKPYLRGPFPLGCILLGMEPSLPTQMDLIELSKKRSPVEGSFNWPLQFAIREFLIGQPATTGFLVTNMAQCSMRVGPTCEETRSKRFEFCSMHLLKLLSLASAKAYLISIGWAPKRFIEEHSDLFSSVFGNRLVHRITHYSPRNNYRFSQFAKKHKVEFNPFVEEFRPAYELFLRERQEDSHNSNGDFDRLFMWYSELRAIRRAALPASIASA